MRRLEPRTGLMNGGGGPDLRWMGVERRGSVSSRGIRGFIPAGTLPVGDFQIERRGR